MKRIYTIGSFKDLNTSRSIVGQIERHGHTALISSPGDPKGIDGCLERIETADLIYVSNLRGDVGKSVSVDLGYALAKGKPLISMKPVVDPPLSHRIRAVETVSQLVETI